MITKTKEEEKRPQ